MKSIKKIALASIFTLLPAFMLGMEYVSFISPKGISLKENGSFAKPQAVAQYLQKAYVLGILPREFRSGCLWVTPLTEELKSAPWATKQLFLVKSTSGQREMKYILKEIAKDPETGASPTEEIKRLVRAATAQRLQPFVYPKSVNGFPQFIFPISYLGYKYKGKNHYLALMPQAQGTSLGSLMKKLKQNPKDKTTQNIVAQAYFYLGKSMANFYKKFGSLGKTIIQGDLHASNIFYNPKDNQIALIDNERMKKGLENPVSISEDLDFLLFKSVFVLKWTHNLKGFPAKKWYELTIPNFIAGFLSTYSQKDVVPIFKKLTKKITYSHWFKQASEELGHGKYIGPILDTMKEKWSTLEAFANDADINVKRDGKTNLHKRAASGTILVRPLLLAGADVKARDNDNNTPLHEAAWFNKPHVIELLIMAGADMNAKDKKGNTPLAKAKLNKSKEAIAKLKQFGAQ